MIIITMVDIEVVVDNNNTQENRATVFGCLSNNSVDKKFRLTINIFERIFGCLSNSVDKKV